MSPSRRNVLAVIIGLVVGGAVNMGLITVGMSVVPLPPGTDVSTMEAVRKSMKILGPANFVFPLLGHAVGTLVGAFATAKIAVNRKLMLALVIGVCFLLGGVAMILNCGGPTWFVAIDLLLAYLPMAGLGGFLAGATRATAG